MNTTADLRTMLLDEIALVRKGQSTPSRLRAMAHAASTIVKSKQLDMDWNRTAAQFDIAAPVELAA